MYTVYTLFLPDAGLKPQCMHLYLTYTCTPVCPYQESPKKVVYITEQHGVLQSKVTLCSTAVVIMEFAKSSTLHTVQLLQKL